MLHLILHSPFKCDFDALMRMLASGDDVLLIQDGVVAAMEGSQALGRLIGVPVSLYVLRDDVLARGLSAQISASITQVGYTDFVALTVKHPQLVTW